MLTKISTIKMKKLKEIIDVIDILFQNQNIELFINNNDIVNAWLVGDAMRDLCITDNPQIENYTFYLQVNDRNKIFDWIKRLNEKEVNTYLLPQNELIEPNITYQHLVISLLNYGINTEINIITGHLPGDKFVEQYMPINLNMIGLNISKLFSYENDFINNYELTEDVSPTLNEELYFFIKNELNKSIWKNDLFDKGRQNKKILVLKHEWMKSKNGMEFLEQYLQKTNVKLSSFIA